MKDHGELAGLFDAPGRHFRPLATWRHQDVAGLKFLAVMGFLHRQRTNGIQALSQAPRVLGWHVLHNQ